MTRDELLATLRGLKPTEGRGDPESTHSAADDALLKYIDDPEIAEAYYALERWYA